MKVVTPVQLPKRGGHFLEDRREEKQINQIRIELRPSAVENDFGGFRGIAPGPVAPRVRDCIIGVRDGDNPGSERNLRSAQASRIPGPVPALVMTQHTDAKIRIKTRERREHIRSTLRVRGDLLPLARRQRRVIMDDVVDGRMDLSDVVEERDALDAATLMLIQVGGAREDQGIRGNTANMRAGFGVVGVNGVEQRLESRRRKTLGGTPGRELARGEQTPDRAHGQSGNGVHHIVFSGHRQHSKQEAGDLPRDAASS